LDNGDAGPGLWLVWLLFGLVRLSAGHADADCGDRDDAVRRQEQRIVWSATSETINRSSVQKDAPGFADVILASLRKDDFLHASR